jgi:hypothetical protein
MLLIVHQDRNTTARPDDCAPTLVVARETSVNFRSPKQPANDAGGWMAIGGARLFTSQSGISANVVTEPPVGMRS